MRGMILALAVMVTASTHMAKAADLSPQLAPLSFMIGDWRGSGKSEGGNVDTGFSSIEPAAGGEALIRRDHNDVSTVNGKHVASFDQIMIIYSDAGALRADYVDGEHHVIHYDRATIAPGTSAQFVSVSVPNAPLFRLTYTKMSDAVIEITFEMRPPGATDFALIAKGQVHRKKESEP